MRLAGLVMVGLAHSDSVVEDVLQQRLITPSSIYRSWSMLK